ncbi:MAG: hypothetical protein M0R22_13650, partial [Dehalococcoidia bacterium]|nr:hypothetical protein [Dehalococcoidia bacterium]
MAIVQKGQYKTTPPTLAIDGDYGILQLDEDSNLRVRSVTSPTAVGTRSGEPGAEKVLVNATAVEGAVGNVVTVAIAGTIYVRADASDAAYSLANWRVKSDNIHDVQLYKARSDVSTGTITLADGADVDTGETFLLNGATITAEDTAASAAFASRKWYSGGADATAEAAELVKLINADWAITCDGSITAADTVTIKADGTDYVYTAKNGSPNYALRQFDMSGNAAAELASLVLAINNKDTVTCATATAGDTVTVNNGVAAYTFTGHATTTTAADREWDIADNDAAASAIATCVNDRSTVIFA